MEAGHGVSNLTQVATQALIDVSVDGQLIVSVVYI